MIRCRRRRGGGARRGLGMLLGGGIESLLCWVGIGRWLALALVLVGGCMYE